MLDVVYGANSVSLIAILPGDFNHDGFVDAADYVVWRKIDGGPVGYNSWKSNFGELAAFGSGASTSAVIPEPEAHVLLMFAAVGWCVRRGRAA
jgi:hypothetical protein